MADVSAESIPRLTTPRLEPVPRVAELAREYAKNALVAPINLSATLAHAKPISKAIQVFSGVVSDPELMAPRLREIVILRTGWNTNAIYEWGQHVMAARKIGISDDDIIAIKGDLSDRPWSPIEAAAIQMADELCSDDCITDATWDALTANTSVETAVAMITLCGSYRMVGGLLNSLGIQPEADLPGWDLRPSGDTTAS
jgi:4-carboxymuconolactone decarboxylase